jgi:hypothetical protein
MSLDSLIKYIMWIVFFGLALVGIYFILNKIGVM